MGEYAFDLGVKAFAVLFPCTNDNYIISPVYWVPNYTVKNLSLGAMRLLYGLKSTPVEPLAYFDFIDHSRKKFACANTVKNSMDYFKLNVIIPTKVLESKSKR